MKRYRGIFQFWKTLVLLRIACWALSKADDYLTFYYDGMIHTLQKDISFCEIEIRRLKKK